MFARSAGGGGAHLAIALVYLLLVCCSSPSSTRSSSWWRARRRYRHPLDAGGDRNQLNVESFMGRSGGGNRHLGANASSCERRERRARGQKDGRAQGHRGRQDVPAAGADDRLAMILGMVPMALAIGEGGEQNAPLGRAVIGGPEIVRHLRDCVRGPAVYTLLRRAPPSASSWREVRAESSGAARRLRNV